MLREIKQRIERISREAESAPMRNSTDERIVGELEGIRRTLGVIAVVLAEGVEPIEVAKLEEPQPEEPVIAEPQPEPRVDQDGVPWCETSCQHHDGKRCEMLGQRPSSICEPAVVRLARAAKAVR
jgi:hypothetical protein